MRPHILVTRDLPGPALRLLAESCEVDLNREERTLRKEEIVAMIPGKAGLLCTLSDRVDREVINAGKELKIIANYAVGINNIDVSYAKQNRIFVTNTPDVLTDATADIAWALILTLTRRIIPADRFTREGKFRGWAPGLFLGKSIQKKVLGIIGMGRIGKAVARRGVAFGMKVVYSDPNRLGGEEEKNLSIQYLPFQQLLRAADVLTLHLPLTEESRGLVGEKELASMKKGVFLINTARGEIVNEKALVRFLKSGHLAGAGLDVYEREPAMEEELKMMENVVLLPHIGSATVEVREKMAMVAAQNILAALRGEKPPNCVF
ncbi:MAG: D-glycerate dehydrogenase [Acidobacteriota bacterium]